TGYHDGDNCEANKKTAKPLLRDVLMVVSIICKKVDEWQRRGDIFPYCLQPGYRCANIGRCDIDSYIRQMAWINSQCQRLYLFQKRMVMKIFYNANYRSPVI